MGRWQLRTIALGTVLLVLAIAISPDALDDWVVGQRAPWQVAGVVVGALAAAEGSCCAADCWASTPLCGACCSTSR